MTRQQNNTFRDNYLDLPFDLSKVFFIATANQLGPIPMPLRDRMEIIQLAGYSDREKLNIAKQYLIPRQIKENGLTPEQLEITDDAINLLTARYTREAGVRQLERTIGNLARKVASEGRRRARPKTVDRSRRRRSKDISDRRGSIPKTAREDLPPGVATGMAWTEMGGEVLFIEATLLPGGGGLTLTGQLGDVMKESAQAARSYLWSHADGIRHRSRDDQGERRTSSRPAGDPERRPERRRHDGVGLASLYTGRKVRPDTAMTGEITLSGLVFPVGGIKEKVLAAHRAGIRRYILPAQRGGHRGNPRRRPRGTRDHSRDLGQRRSQSGP